MGASRIGRRAGLGTLPHQYQETAKCARLDAPPTKVSGKDVPMPYAANLEKLALPTVDDLIKAVKAVCYKA